MKLPEVNALSKPDFVDALGWVFEHSPWVAEQAWNDRPFTSPDHLCECMNRIVEAAPQAEQLALLRAHPDLGTRARVSVSSEREQAGAGLDKLTEEEYETLTRLNLSYKTKFGFPFLYAVKGSGKFDVLNALQQRLGGAVDEELPTALRQVYQIARFRLEEIIK